MKRSPLNLTQVVGLKIWCLMPLSTIFQLYLGDLRRKVH